MTILCSDKSGTLTKNELAIKDPKILPGWELKYIYLYETLACRRHEGQDHIDLCIS
jgi:magnesium-transporting ATPase (P-type)